MPALHRLSGSLPLPCHDTICARCGSLCRRRSPAESSEIYVGDNYDENYDISPFERGRCTDSYSKAWCDSHGFANNRTVPHKVKLNAKEEACPRDPYLAGVAEVIAGLVTTGPDGGLFATAMTSYRLFTCMF